MNFSEKLLNLRKEKKFSQEELADMLDVTRQSVSKWESGQTYPEMDKLLAICKIFDCTLEELTNDDIKFEDFKKDNKNNISSVVNSVLSFINQTYNYFTHITFKEFIKCAITMFIVFIIICIIKYPFDGLNSVFYNMLRIFESRPFIYSYLTLLFSFIIDVVYYLMSIFLFIYIFKIGFLDKKLFVKEDSEVEEIVIRDKISKEEAKENDKKKIIVRSNSDVENKILKAIGSIIMFFVKAFLAFIAVPFVIMIVLLSFCLAIDVYLMFQGVVLLGIFFGLIFAIMLTALVIEFICDIILNKKHNAKRMLITLLIGLIGGGISAGILAIEFSKYEFIDGTPSDALLNKETYSFKYKDGMYIDSYFYGYSTKIDNTLKNNEIILEINNYSDMNYVYASEDAAKNAIVVHHNVVDRNINEYIDMIIRNLKDKKIYSYYNHSMTLVTVTANEAVLKKLETSLGNVEVNKIRDNYENKISNLQKEIDNLNNQINDLEDEKEKLEAKNNELQGKITKYKEKINSLVE